jgi:hypothetical protein
LLRDRTALFLRELLERRPVAPQFGDAQALAVDE